MRRRQTLLEVIVSLLVFLFLYASISKFIAFRTFTNDMNNQPLPKTWTPFLVWCIPCGEIVLSLLVIIERTRLFGFYGSIILLSLFTVYTIVILANAFSYVPCSCGGIIRQLSWRQHLVFNLLFLGIAITGAILQRQKLRISNQT